ncbi:UNVERIFIED_CONTAM: hypothetical protein HDU68_008459 [Siphonaria sp. JEL0065]|nr:hypothetical protein HDU68_008459 [Siphonaria sp. JEL0065]
MTTEIAIVGGSLAGLAAATVLIRLGIIVTVFEKYNGSFENRGSSLGYVNIPLWEHLSGHQMIRRGTQMHRYQGAFYYGDLWRFWYSGLPEGTVKFGYTVTDLGEDPERPTIDGKTYDAVILADGGWSSLRSKYITKKQPEYSGHVIYRCKVSKKDFPDFVSEAAYPVGKFFSIALEVALDNGVDHIMGGVLVPTPENEVSRPTDVLNRQIDWTAVNNIPPWFLPHVRRTFGKHKQLVQWIEMAVNGPGRVSMNPLFEFGADVVTNKRIILIGDAAHMASPSTAAGAHTGVLDAAGLLEAFAKFPRKEHVDQAIAQYSPGGLKRAADLYNRSKDVTRAYAYVPGDEQLYNPDGLKNERPKEKTS